MDALERPVLFVASSQDWAVAESERVAAEWPRASVSVLEGTGHTVFVDAPMRFNRVLDAFISKVRN
jgi:pimeloyl-ACP methyl ester carboxylesterase